MNRHHQKLLKKIKELSSKKPVFSKLSDNYSGTDEKHYPITNPQIRKIAKKWVKENQNIAQSEFEKLLNSLYLKSNSSTEKYLAGYLIEYLPDLRVKINPKILENWLTNLNGWAQIDSLCQSKFGYEDLNSSWKNWKETLIKFNKSTNISKRRASLVLLIKPLRDVKDERFKTLAFENIEKLKNERDILITKAISWILREMVKLHKESVSEYLEKNKESLPKIAVRETQRKINTGKK